MALSSKRFLATFVLIIFLVNSLQAGVPEFIPYQGYLTDALGEPVSGSLDLHFTLYDQSTLGQPLWQESHSGVAVIAGFFQVALGDLVPLNDELLVTPLYLGITVAGEDEMTPRMRIGSVPFSRVSGAMACPVGQTNCGGGVCADLDNDPNHCSQCNLGCAIGEVCFEGACAAGQDAISD